MPCRKGGRYRLYTRHLQQSYDMVGRRADALALYRELLDHLPNDVGDEQARPLALFTVAWVLTRDHTEIHDPERAADFARSAVAIAEARGTSRSIHRYLDTLALALHQTGATAEAIEVERRAIDRLRPGASASLRGAYEASLQAYEASSAESSDLPAERPDR